MLPTVVQVFTPRDFDLVIQFDDGKIVQWNAESLVRAGGVFARLRDPATFRKELTVLNGTVAWSSDFNPETCLDLDPLVLYNEGIEITENHLPM